MNSILAFDEINKPGWKKRAIPIKEYFEPMGISEEDKRKREEFADKFADKMNLIFQLAAVYAYFGMYTQQWFIEEIKLSYRTVLLEYMELDTWVEEHIQRFAESTEQNTDDHMMWSAWYLFRDDGMDFPESWWTSTDRAEFIAENEANVIFNNDELNEAIAEGYQYKTWHTMQDRRVRDSHRDVNGITVPIEDYFIVNGEYGAFPGDDELPPEETVNCRCWLTYS